MKKIIFRLFIFTLLLIFGFVIYISTIGIKTDAFNNQIFKEVKKIDNQLEETLPAKKIKCVCWDLDNTLWNGVIGDDGTDGVIVNNKIIDLINEFDKKGILQTITSKNEYEIAWSKIKQLGLDKFFLYPAINWGPKSESIKQIAKELNIGIDTFALIDDSEWEREEVSSNCPQVRVYHPDKIITLSNGP